MTAWSCSRDLAHVHYVKHAKGRETETGNRAVGSSDPWGRESEKSKLSILLIRREHFARRIRALLFRDGSAVIAWQLAYLLAYRAQTRIRLGR